MAGSSWSKGNINHCKQLANQLRSLFKDRQLKGDVSIVCGHQSFSCHRSILASRSKYFKALLYGGMKESQPEAVIEIQDVEPESFELLLEYLYSANICLSRLPINQVLQLLELAHRYELSLLEKDICSYLLTQISPHNAAHICQLATFYHLMKLQSHCLQLIDNNPRESLQNLGELSGQTLHAVIARDSYPLSEMEIFSFVQRWLTDTNRSVSENEKQALLNDIRLSLIEPEAIFLKIIPTKLYSSQQILDALKDITLKNHVDLPHRGVSKPYVNLVKEDMMTFVSGENGEVLFACYDCNAERPHCQHIIGDQSGITVKFNYPTIINKISMLLPGNKEVHRLYSYKISISVDGTRWKVITNYEKYHCHGWQHIVMAAPRAVLYIRILGLWCSTSQTFCIESLFIEFNKKLHYPMNVDSDGVIEPFENMATIERGAMVVEGVSRHRSTLLNGDTSLYDWEDGYTCHQVGSGAIIVLLNQPYLLSHISMLLWDCDERCYSYIISVSSDKKYWIDIVDKSNEHCSSWQHHTFPCIPVSYIRIIGTQNSANSVFHLVHIEVAQHKPSVDTEPEGSNSEQSTSCSDNSSVKSDIL